MSDEKKVAYVLELDVPGVPKGQEIEIPGLGVFKNGATHEIDEDAAENYRDANVTAEPEVGKNNEILSVEVTRGQTLLQAGNSMMEGITVSTAAEEKKPEPKKKEGES